MTIYLDIIFVENILMNYIILFATLVILKVKNKWQQIRLLLSGIIGSVYAIIVYLDILPIYSGIIAKAILSIVMVYVAFNPQSIKQLFKQLLIFYLISFIFGGCTFALIYFIRPENVQMRNGVFVGMYPIKVAIIGGVIGFIITQIAFKINKNKLNTKNTIFDIQIYYEDKTINIKALLDSGNMLKDPVSEIPVIISPFRIGILFTKPIALRERDFMLKMPIAATLPNNVEAVAASRAIVIVLIKAFIKE